MRTAVYGGSFDPITNGHLWMIKEGARLFDYLHVIVASNPAKNHSLPHEVRKHLIEQTLQIEGIENADVKILGGHQFLIDEAQVESAGYLLRGIRDGSDFMQEQNLRLINKDLNRDIETVFLMPPREFLEVSSSAVRALMLTHRGKTLLGKYVPLPVQHHLSPQNDLEFLDAWEKVTGDTSGRALSKFYDIRTRMNRPSEGYHNLMHIEECIDLLLWSNGGWHGESLEDIETVLAIWYHDAVYFTQMSDNEEQSAELFWSHAMSVGDRKTKPLIDTDPQIESFRRISRMIRLTRDHRDTNLTRQEQKFLDIDLAILGTPWERFQNYDDSIRREYHWVPADVYYTKRAEILRSFLKEESIYKTELFRKRFESQARQNLYRILESYDMRK